MAYKKSKNVNDYKISESRMTRMKMNVVAIKANNDNELKMVVHFRGSLFPFRHAQYAR